MRKTFEQLNEGDYVYVDGSKLSCLCNDNIISRHKITLFEYIYFEKKYIFDRYNNEEIITECNILHIKLDNYEDIKINLDIEHYNNVTSLKPGQGVGNFVATTFDEVKEYKINKLKNKLEQKVQDSEKIKQSISTIYDTIIEYENIYEQTYFN